MFRGADGHSIWISRSILVLGRVFSLGDGLYMNRDANCRLCTALTAFTATMSRPIDSPGIEKDFKEEVIHDEAAYKAGGEAAKLHSTTVRNVSRI